VRRLAGRGERQNGGLDSAVRRDNSFQCTAHLAHECEFQTRRRFGAKHARSPNTASIQVEGSGTEDEPIDGDDDLRPKPSDDTPPIAAGNPTASGLALAGSLTPSGPLSTGTSESNCGEFPSRFAIQRRAIPKTQDRRPTLTSASNPTPYNIHAYTQSYRDYH
jgi:hypothetical protein